MSAPYMGSMMFYVHAQMVVFSEHAQDVLLFHAHAYWWEGLSIPTDGCLCACLLCLLILSFGVLNRTLSHIWCRLYLLTFPLFVGGLLTLMQIGSLILLTKPWSSLPLMVKLSELEPCPEVSQWPKMGEGSLRCSLYLYPKVLDLYPKVLEVSHIYSSSHQYQ